MTTRTELEKINNARIKFVAVFERYGIKTGWKGRTETTILLKNVSDGSNIMTEHIWFTMTKGFNDLGELKCGDIIQFDARVKEYIKGYVNNREFIDERVIDYKLSHPTKIKKVEELL